MNRNERTEASDHSVPGHPKSVLVPLDGSAFGEQALPWLLAVANPRDEIHLVCVVDFGPPTGPVGDREDPLEEAGEYLEGVAERLGRPPGKVHLHPEVGVPARAVRRAASRHHIDLILAATHGDHWLSRALFGSMADRLITDSPVPVLLVRPPEPADPSVRVRGPIETLVPPETLAIYVGDSPTKDTVLEAPRLLSLPTHGEVTLIGSAPEVSSPVISPATPMVVATDPQLGADAVSDRSDRLDLVAERLRRRGWPDVRVEVILGSPERALSDRVGALGVDVVALALGSAEADGVRPLDPRIDDMVRTTDVPTLVLTD